MTVYRLRNMNHPSWDYFGDPRVGLPSEDIDPSGLMGDDAVTYSDHLLRMFSSNIPNGTFINEDGSYTGEPPSYWELYVDGVNVGGRGVEAENRSVPIIGPGSVSNFRPRTVIIGDQAHYVRTQTQLNSLLNQYVMSLEMQQQEKKKKVLMVQNVEVEKSFLSWLSDTTQ